MFDTLYTALTATGSSALASVLTCLIMRWIMRHDEQERKKSEKELFNAREARLTKIEDGIEKVTSALQRHIQEDSKNPNADDISSINRRLDKIDDAQSRVTESAETSALKKSCAALHTGSGRSFSTISDATVSFRLTSTS